MWKRIASLLTVCSLSVCVSGLAGQGEVAFKQGAKVFVAPMPNDFDTYLQSRVAEEEGSNNYRLLQGSG